MLQTDFSNTIFQLAVDLVNHTSQHIFLTGKAGTGKTTFLKYIKETSGKNIVVVAPTGVAAINAGGVTMHSFFQLPRGMFIPGFIDRDARAGSIEITDRHSLMRNIRFNSDKRKLLQELDLLIIDEVSMVRCDMLDAIDVILRQFRRAPILPFGGVQVLYIGDMFQLPPVVNNDEWNLLQNHYQSPFFFNSKVVSETPPLYLELKKIYRQSEERFIGILNAIRNNNVSVAEFEFLNRNYNPNFLPPPGDHYITVTTHNKKADAINAEELNKLPGKLYAFKAEIKDDFSDKSFPTEQELQLKVGAQVMFIKNDSGENRRYFNGKIGVITSIKEDEIKVSHDDNGNDLVLEKETWNNVRYILGKEHDDIDEEVLGSFTQYPIRLAWAITVHKSQGLTFEKAIIDAGASFAPGQVYVALSRCTSMDGVVLRSKILPYAVSTDKRIIEFAQREINDTGLLNQILDKEKYRHWALQLIKAFDWYKLTDALEDWREIVHERKLPDPEEAIQLVNGILRNANEQSAIAQKFQKQLREILGSDEKSTDISQLTIRMEKALVFFTNAIADNILTPIMDHLESIKYASRVNKYRELVNKIYSTAWGLLQKLLNAKYGELGFAITSDFSKFEISKEDVVNKRKKKEPKGTSQNASLELFRNGKTINEIAALRNLSPTTIETHLAKFVGMGEIEATELMESEKLSSILKKIGEVGTESTGLIKGQLGDGFSYHEIRVALNHYYYLQKKTA